MNTGAEQVPLRITITEGRTITEMPLAHDRLPIELYFRAGFEDEPAAIEWCEDAVKALATVALDDLARAGHRFVVWGPKKPEPPWTGIGRADVYVSEFALRVLRALGKLRVPAAVPVSLSQLGYGLFMYTGGDADAAAYRAVRSE